MNINFPKGRIAYTIMETQVTDKGEYIPCICIENHGGFYLTDWAWGTDLEKARECADEKNAELGLTKEEAMKIVFSTMKPIPKTREARHKY